MAHTKSGRKRIRTAEKRRVRNQAIRSKVKTIVKKVVTAVEANNLEEANVALKVACRELDKAVTKGILKKNTASRKKSRLTQSVNKIAK